MNDDLNFLPIYKEKNIYFDYSNTNCCVADIYTHKRDIDSSSIRAGTFSQITEFNNSTSNEQQWSLIMARHTHILFSIFCITAATFWANIQLYYEILSNCE